MEISGGKNLTANEIFVSKLVRRYLFPSICAMVGMEVSGFVTGVLLGNMLGSLGLSVFSLVMPVSFIYFSLGSLIGVGSSIISGIALGKGDTGQCGRVYTFSYLVLLGLAAILTTVGLANLDLIVNLLGATEEKFALTRDYVRFYIAGGAGVLLLYIPYNYLRIVGKPKSSMGMLLLMGLFNIVGLCIFVVLLDMGPGGAALSSVISSALTFILGLCRCGGRNSPLKFRLPSKAFSTTAAAVVAGSPSALNNVCQAIQILGINLLLVKLAATVYLPSYSLVRTVSDIAGAVILGISQTMIPLVGISFGEKDFRSIRIILKKALGVGNIIIAICALVLVLIHRSIGGFFGLRDETLLWNTGIAFIFLAASLNLAFINNVIMNYFSAIRRTAIANIMVVSRLVLFIVIPSWLLFAVLGVYAVWTSLILAEVATLILTFFLVTTIHKKTPRLSRYLLLDSALIENSTLIDFSVKNTVGDLDAAITRLTDFCEEHEVQTKKAMYISLAVEEMLIMINEHSLIKDKTEYTDVRIMITRDDIVLRIRNIGKYFNPVEYFYENRNTEDGASQTMGIAMILKMARHVEYRETFGVNNLVVTIN
jgi:Na+-driven multidrug efflux pump/anti-sigma regulatory factor (Ser/Thr protein kinase)